MRNFPNTAFDLQSLICGDVAGDTVSRALVSTDGSIYRLLPQAVCYPKNVGDVQQIVHFCNDRGISLHPRGAGSGLCGGCLGNGIVIDFTRYMNRLIRIDPEERWFECEPGYRLGELDTALASAGLFFPPDPSSGEFATFGGMFSTNASGSHSVKYGNVADYVLDAEIVLSDGGITSLADLQHTSIAELQMPFRNLAALYAENRQTIETGYPAIACNTAGYNLRGLVREGRLDARKLFSGAEGTLGIVTKIRFRLIERPSHDALVIAFFGHRAAAAAVVPELLSLQPAGIEIMDRSLLSLAREQSPILRKEIPQGIDAVLMIEFDGNDEAGCRDKALEAHRMLQHLQHPVESFTALTRDQQNRFWAVRKAAVPLLYKLPGRRKILALIEDAAVPTQHVAAYLEQLETILNAKGVPFVLYGHIAKGLIHTRPLLDLKQTEDRALLQPLVAEVGDLVRSLGGTVSGEHGDGRLRSGYLARQYPALYPLFVKTKHLLDPGGIFNPDIVVSSDPGLVTRHLRAECTARPIQRRFLRWPTDMQEAIDACHGCSKCTTVTTATRMCPVYKFTREEAAAPKAKANILREMMIQEFSEAESQHAIREVIDRCIGCGSCRMECPSGVDIPKLALEVKHRKEKGSIEKLRDCVLTGLESGARLSGLSRGRLDRILSLAPLRRLAQQSLGIAGWRKPVRYQTPALSSLLAPRQGGGSVHVLYFLGCFANHIRPSIGRATLNVLLRMGFCVHIPKQVCCALPMIAHGMIQEARKRIACNMASWASLLPEIDFIVVSCSSCGLSLMHHWMDVQNGPTIASIADRTIHVSDLIERFRDRLPPLNDMPHRNLGYHQPCHLRLQPNADASIHLLKKLPGITLHTPTTHCCGMGGTWGYESAHDALSREIGADLIERLQAAETVVTDCPTCMLQIEDLSHFQTRHPIEVLAERIPRSAGDAAVV
ncbi:FAD-binding and (Fe-S)-binding domain-containing protein [Desulfatirhabdium butyrativorans]|uniref:FAD-binding and (Fe-S)-binding domain-containing protein n=1 Tax=Desulfatirhabdium butyrativorans TaxID=340467 RepID=UPI0003F4ED71|nr:FAD-binding oxidoreductase [Desulfatirhabdium butyrativorans]